MANNALLYSSLGIPRYARESETSKLAEDNGASLIESLEEMLEKASEESSSTSESSSDKFTMSLIESLKENGLTSTQNVDQINRVAVVAQSIVAAVKEKDGAAAANQFKALILTEAQDVDAEELLSAAVETYVAGKAIELATESNETTRKALEERKKKDAEIKLETSKEEIAKKAEEEIERNVEQKVAEETDKAAQKEAIAKEEDNANLVSTIKSTIEDVKKLAFGSEDVTVAIQEIIPVLNKVKADLNLANQTVYGDYDIEDRLSSLRNLNYAQTSAVGFGAYASRSPMPGSLLSLTV